jgi:hypothetical protein
MQIFEYNCNTANYYPDLLKPDVSQAAYCEQTMYPNIKYNFVIMLGIIW